MIKKLLKQTSICAIALTIALVFSSVIFAAPVGYSLFGDASLVSPGNNSPTAAQVRSDVSIAPEYGGVDFAVTAGLTFADYSTLSTDYKITAGGCGAGSPRFQFDVINPNTNAHSTIDVYFMNVNVSQVCPTGSWVNSGNLTTLDGNVDNIPEAPNTYVSYAAAKITYGLYEVTGIQLVVDSGYLFPQGEIFLFDNVVINNTTFTFENANSCKNGGYLTYLTAPPGPFANQGACVSYYAKGGQ